MLFKIHIFDPKRLSKKTGIYSIIRNGNSYFTKGHYLFNINKKKNYNKIGYNKLQIKDIITSPRLLNDR